MISKIGRIFPRIPSCTLEALIKPCLHWPRVTSTDFEKCTGPIYTDVSTAIFPFASLLTVFQRRLNGSIERNFRTDRRLPQDTEVAPNGSQ